MQEREGNFETLLTREFLLLAMSSAVPWLKCVIQIQGPLLPSFVPMCLRSTTFSNHMLDFFFYYPWNNILAQAHFSTAFLS